MLSVLLIASGIGLWWRWEPWTLEYTLKASQDGEHYDFIKGEFSHDGRRLATAVSRGTIIIWNCMTGKAENSLYSKGSRWSGDVGFLRYSLDDHLLVTVDDEHWTRIWDAQTGEVLKTLDYPSEIVRSPEVAFANPSKLKEGTVEYMLYHKLYEQRIVPKRILFLPGNKMFLSFDSDDRNRLWDIREGVIRRVFEHSKEEIVVTAFLRSDSLYWLSTASNYKKKEFNALIWDAGLKKRIAVLGGHETYVGYTLTSPDGRRVLTMAANTARIWTLESKNVVLTAQKTFDGEKLKNWLSNCWESIPRLSVAANRAARTKRQAVDREDRKRRQHRNPAPKRP